MAIGALALLAPIARSSVSEKTECQTRPKRNVNHIETPALLVDLDAMEHNLRSITQFFSTQKAKLRPHFKNHRVLELAALQLQHGAVGITCARLWQAERLGALRHPGSPYRQ